MKEDWVRIYSHSQAYNVEIVKALLADNNIESVILNKKDSNYFFGEVELYVSEEDVLIAKQIIDKNAL
ncbi:MAG: DUF2007 domain-containing protein [Bacteroidales bacterium]|nr:DUF2007 domain-containing protein [Bacteroidales bacterium]